MTTLLGGLSRFTVIVLVGLAVSSPVHRAHAAGSLTDAVGAATGAGTYTDFDTVNVDGDVRPGNSPGVMHFGGNVTFGAAATLEIELANTTPGTGYDQVKVAGHLSLGGTLNVVLIGLTPAAGQSFDILDWGSLSGTFSSLNLPPLTGLSWNTSQLYTTGILGIITVAPIAGDYNVNGTVDAADYVRWRNNVGTTNTLPNDPIGGTIGVAQYNIWRAQFGRTGGRGGSRITNVTVPEPSSDALLLIALLGAVVSRRQPSITPSTNCDSPADR